MESNREITNSSNKIEEIRRRSIYHEDSDETSPTYAAEVNAEIVLNDNGKTVYLTAQWVSLADDCIDYFVTTKPLYDIFVGLFDFCTKLTKEEFDALCQKKDKIEKNYSLYGEDAEKYENYRKELFQMVFSEMEENGYDPEECLDDEYFEGKEEEEFDIPEDKEACFRRILGLESTLAMPSAFLDIEGSGEQLQKYLDKLRKVYPETDYAEWKKSYLDSEYEAAKDTSFTTISYMVYGIGSYRTVCPSHCSGRVKNEINMNGSWVVTGEAPATEEEIRLLIGMAAERTEN